MGVPVGSAWNMRQIATPASGPPSGQTLLYAKSDGKIYTKNSVGGVEAMVGPGLSNADLWMRRAQSHLTGGGALSVDINYNISWDTRFIPISYGRWADTDPSGYFSIDMPPVGTVIPGVGGATDVTVTAAGIALPVWGALYYIIPFGSGSANLPGNYRIGVYSADFDAPANWLLVAVRNGDLKGVRFANGVTVAAGAVAREGGSDSTVYGFWQSNNTGNVATGTWTTRAGWGTGTGVLNTNPGGFVFSGGAATIKVSGVYLVNGIVTFSPNATGRRICRVLVNGATIIFQNEGQAVAGGTSRTGLSFNGVGEFNAGDTVEIQGYQTSGAALSWDGAKEANNLQIIRMGPKAS